MREVGSARVVLTGEDLMLWRLYGLGVRLRPRRRRNGDGRGGGHPVDGRRPGELDDDRLEPDHVAGGRVPGRRHQVRVVRLVADRGAVRLERDAPRRRLAQAVVRLARVRAERVDRHQPYDQRVVGPLFEQVGRHRQHPVGPPPRDDGPRPTDRVALQHGGAVQGDDHGRALLADHVGRPGDRVCARRDGGAT